MEWLNKIVESILKLIPTIWLVDPDEGGVRVTLGTGVKTCPPGWYFYWGLIQTVMKVPTVDQIIDLRTQSAVTGDGFPVLVSGALRYTVFDPKKAILQVEDYDKAIHRIALGAILSFIATKNRNNVCPANVVERVEDAVSGQMRDWGIRYGAAWVTDLSFAKTYRISLGDGIHLTEGMEY